MNNKPQYKIHGIERRNLKKELSRLKSYVRTFWFYHQMDKDMAGPYVSDDAARVKYNEAVKDIKDLESKLSVPFNK